MNIKLELVQNAVFDAIKERLQNAEIDADEIADTNAIKALSEIRDIIGNDEISDFEAVEEIVLVFEKYGITAGGRHDF